MASCDLERRRHGHSKVCTLLEACEAWEQVNIADAVTS